MEIMLSSLSRHAALRRATQRSAPRRAPFPRRHTLRAARNAPHRPAPQRNATLFSFSMMGVFKMAYVSTPEFAREQSIISARLRELSFGAVLTYDEASNAIGRDVRNSARTSWLSALRLVEKEDGTRRFATVAKVGIKRLPEAEFHTIGKQSRKRMRAAVGRGYRRLDGATANDHVAAEKIRTEKAHLGAIALALRERHSKVVDEAVRTAGRDEVAPAALLAFFAK